MSIVFLLVTAACGDSPLSTPLFRITGTVSGLSGTVVIQNNGTDDLTVTSDGPFAFATSLSPGASYEVTVFTQPVGQTCDVSNGTGTVGGLNVTGIEVTCTT